MVVVVVVVAVAVFGCCDVGAVFEINGKVRNFLQGARLAPMKEF